MKKNLIKLLAVTLVMGLFVGCSDSDDSDEGGTDPVNCVYAPLNSTVTVGDTYTVECTATLDGAAQECVATGTVDTATAGTYELAYAAATCTENPTATATVTVKEVVTPPSEVTAENILPK